MVDSKKLWSDMSSEETQTVLDNLKQLYKDEPLAKKVTVKVASENVNDLVQGSTDNKVSVSVSGSIGKENKDKAPGLQAKFEEALSLVKDVKIEIEAKYGIGDKVDPVENVTVVLDDQKVDGADKMTFTPKEGTVYLIDFWATWCPPCQGPMAHNQKMLEQHGSEWGDKVEICGFSIDQDAPTVKSHVTSKGWTAPKQYHVRNGVCLADKQFSFRGVPFCVLLDKESKVVFMGHPASRKFEEDFETLMKGEKITGPGTGPSDGDSDEDEGAAKAGVDSAQAIKDFQEGVDKVKQDVDSSVLKSFQRAFLVLVTQSSFDEATGDFKTSMEYYQVMFGSADSIKKVEDAAASLRESSKPWKVNVRQQAM